MRPVYPSAVAIGDLPYYKAFLVPRLVDGDRSPGYAHPGKEKVIPAGYIPQARQTYAYLDGNYGIVNEHGLMFVVSWIALDTPGESVFIPLAVGPLPSGYALGDTTLRVPGSAWWTYNQVSEYANLKYKFMITDIRERAATHEDNSLAILERLRGELQPLAARDPRAAAA